MADDQAKGSWMYHGFPSCLSPLAACSCGRVSGCRCCRQKPSSPHSSGNAEAPVMFLSDEPLSRQSSTEKTDTRGNEAGELTIVEANRRLAVSGSKAPQLSEGSTEASADLSDGAGRSTDDDDYGPAYRGVRIEKCFDFYDTTYRRVRLRKMEDAHWVKGPREKYLASRSDSSSSAPSSRSTSKASSSSSTPQGAKTPPISSRLQKNTQSSTSLGAKNSVEIVTNWGVLTGSLLHTRVIGFADLAGMLLRRENEKKLQPRRYQLMDSVKRRAEAVVNAARSLARQAAHEPMDRLDSEWCEANILPRLFSTEYIDTLLILANTARTIVASQPTLVRAQAPCRVFGDIHGQLRDLLLLFHAFGMPNETNVSFVFNGDFVDRGCHQLEVIGLLLALKVLLPDKVWLVRGNHEDRAMNEKYGFQDDCRSRLGKEFGQKTYEHFHKAFDQLPVACLVAERILCVHGGIGDGRWTLKDLEQVKRPLTGDKLYQSSWIFNILWSDPTDEDDKPGRSGTFGVHASPRFSTKQNQVVNFGWNVTKTFCARNGIGLILRSHECKEGGLGYDVMHDRRLVRVFSARDYEGNGNSGAAIMIRDVTAVEKVQDEFTSSSESAAVSSGPSGKRKGQPKSAQGSAEPLLAVRPQVLQSVIQARQEAHERIMLERSRSSKMRKGTPSRLQQNSEFKQLLKKVSASL
mmetsp:Transcript_137175/g.242507  ORF Transcript_137175/g.242507 Transcript_137175/m.242507 type:complete len:690 (+) Transcript_137175:111-2180(+)